jgi:tRNA A-37 threonylcarbamoyl transferase component Bud32
MVGKGSGARRTADTAPKGVTETVVPLVVRRDSPIPASNEPSATGSGGPPRPKNGTLASIELSGLLATSPDALRRRLLGPWSEGLRQYLAIRLSDVSAGEHALRELRRLVTATPTSELVRDPGPKARAYRLARRVALDRRERPITADEPLVYRTPGDGDRAYLAALDALRRDLPEPDREILELRYARELSPIEIACVLDTTEPDVEERLDHAASAARKLTAGLAADPALFVDAFALVAARTAAKKDAGAEAQGLDAGTIIGGRYRLVARVGVGAFGDVYKADDEDVPGHRVALKLLREPSLSQSARDEALRELKLIAAVFHPSVVLFKDHGWFDDRLWFVMPWYEGETLEHAIRRKGGISRAEGRRIFEPLARALATLHANGIRHQDIKPDNVFLARIKGLTTGGDDAADSLPILLDLGVAAKDSEALIGGTPVYFAPEVAAHYAEAGDETPVGPKADVFALALSLRNALEPETEEDVPAGAVEAFIARRARTAPPIPARRDLRYLAPYFARWLSLDPAQRPSAEVFAKELAALTRPEERRDRLRKTLAWLLPLLVALSAVFAAVVYVFSAEAELQRREIDEARVEVASVRGDLMVEEARRQALDQDHAELMRQYEEGRLSRGELASQLATAQGQIEILGDRIGAMIAEREQITTDLGGIRGRLSQSEAQLASTQGLLHAEQQAHATLERRLEASSSEHLHQEAELEEALAIAEARTEELDEEATRLRTEVSERADLQRTLERRLETAETARERAETELDQLRERLSALRDMLDRPRRPAPEPEHGTEQATDGTGGATPTE